MQKLLCVVILAVTAITAVPVSDEYDSTNFEYPRFVQYTDNDGYVKSIDLEEELSATDLEFASRSAQYNRYFLLSRRNPDTPQELVLNDENSVRSSNYNPSLPTAVIVHGWISNMETGINPTIASAFLEIGDWNVIIMDWSRLAIGSYTLAVNGVPAVGRGLGELLFFLGRFGARFEDMHLVGFSLGAHVVGNAGRFTGGNVARVTGLDPAGPLWNLNRDRLSTTDGVYVEAIHTDGGYTVGGLGIGIAIAHTDFFPNGGISQPGCLTNVCNHNRAWNLFAASVAHNHFLAHECSNNLQITLNTCRGDLLQMGNSDFSKNGRGLYRVETGRRYPF